VDLTQMAGLGSNYSMSARTQAQLDEIGIEDSEIFFST